MNFDVVVVGAGPTGLTATNLLGRYGVRTLLVERNPTTVQEPRAVSIDDESLRTMQSIGVIDRVLAQVVPGYGSIYLTPSGKPFLKVGPTETPYGHPRRNAFRQPILEAQLREHLTAFPSIQSRFGWTVTAFDQDAEGVSLKLMDGEGSQREVRSRYVVAADGASSSIRMQLGLTLEGETFDEQWLIVDLEDSPSASRDTIVFCDALRPCIALPGPNITRRFEFRLMPGDDPKHITDEATVTRLLSDRGAAPGSRIRRKTVYAFHARLASSWTQGRVFLAGDACHLTPPFAGQGMNSGIRDAHNLAWKLAWTVTGALPATILESYELERRDHARQMIQLALRMGRIMSPRNPLVGWAMQTAFRALSCWPAARDYFGQMRYKPKPRFREGLLLTDGRSKRATSVGRLIPQPHVQTLGGSVLLDEVTGNGFTLLGFTDAATLRAAAEKPAIAALKPRLVQVVPAMQGVVYGAIVPIVDTLGALAAGLDKPQGRLFLVRPDRYVLGAFRVDEMEVFAQRLDTLLRRRSA